MLPGTMIGPYEIVEEIGSGGMATVYKAYQAKLDRFVAIKMMHRGMLGDNTFLARFEREARIVARLDHANIVPIYDYDEHDGQPFLVMKFLDAKTLKEMLRRGAPDLDDILRIMGIVAEALTYAHEHGVLHRDIKPSNIIVDQDGTPYLTDFGLARVAKQGESTLSADVMLGTPHYISPEQAQGGPDLNPSTDVYSLGVILYELVTGSVPFTADTPYAIVHKHIYEEPPPPSQVNPEVPPEVEQVLIKALAKEPGVRYSTPVALMAAFDRAVESTGLTELDEDRAQHAAVVIPRVAPQVPKDGKYVVIPSADPGTQPSATAQDIFQEIGDRIRALVKDIQTEVRERDLVDRVKRGFQGAMDRSSITLGQGTRQERDQRALERLVAEDWGTDEYSIRRRVQKRVGRRRGLFMHALVYVIVIGGMAATQPQVQSGLETILTNPSSEFIIDTGVTYLGPIATLNYTLFLALMWGGGLVNHALRVFYNTGGRLENQRRAFRSGLEEYYGPDWQDTIELKQYRRYRRRIVDRYKRRVGLIAHFFTFVMISAAAFVIWPPILEVLQASPEVAWPAALADENAVPALWTLLQAIGLVIHMVVYGLAALVGSEARERAMQREIARERELSMVQGAAAKPKRPADAAAKSKRRLADLVEDANPAVRLTGDGEFTESFVDEMDDNQQQVP